MNMTAVVFHDHILECSDCSPDSDTLCPIGLSLLAMGPPPDSLAPNVYAQTSSQAAPLGPLSLASLATALESLKPLPTVFGLMPSKSQSLIYSPTKFKIWKDGAEIKPLGGFSLSYKKHAEPLLGDPYPYKYNCTDVSITCKLCASEDAKEMAVDYVTWEEAS